MSKTGKVAAVKLNRILLATDLSSASLWSLPYVTEIANHCDSTVFVAHAIPFGTYAVARPESFDRVEEECWRGAQEKLDNICAALEHQGIRAKTLLTEGDIGAIFPQWVKKHRIDLAAVGTTGRSGVRKLFLGSVAEEIVRHADCAVLTVAQPSTSSPGTAVSLRTILFATDFSADSLKAWAYLKSLAERHLASIVAVHIRADNDTKLSRANLAERLRRLTADCNRPTEALIGEGRPAAKILEIACEHSADLIAIGVRGAGGLPRMASHFGSTAHDIIIGASCPVLTVRRAQRTPSRGDD